MYLSKLQLKALVEINARGRCGAAPELVNYLLHEGLIGTDLAGYLVADKGQVAIRMTNNDLKRLADENKDSAYAEWEWNNSV